MKRCLQLREEDNVATLLEDAAREPVHIAGIAGEHTVELREPVAMGHKVATRAIARDELIMKYGAPIGAATQEIERGAWVHLHNMRSLVDERSATFDTATGATTDTVYE